MCRINDVGATDVNDKCVTAVRLNVIDPAGEKRGMILGGEVFQSLSVTAIDDALDEPSIQTVGNIVEIEVKRICNDNLVST